MQHTRKSAMLKDWSALATTTAAKTTASFAAIMASAKNALQKMESAMLNIAAVSTTPREGGCNAQQKLTSEEPALSNASKKAHPARKTSTAVAMISIATKRKLLPVQRNK